MRGLIQPLRGDGDSIPITAKVPVDPGGDDGEGTGEAAQRAGVPDSFVLQQGRTIMIRLIHRDRMVCRANRRVVVGAGVAMMSMAMEHGMRRTQPTEEADRDEER